MKSSLSLLDRLIVLLPDSTKTSLRSWIKQGRVTVDGTVVTQASLPVEAGQEIKLHPKAKFTTQGEIPILYADRFLVVVNKPEGVLSVKAPFEHEKTLHKYLKATFGTKNVRVVHRLDQGTSGVMLFALEEKTYSALKKMFEKHDLTRKYTAILEGTLEEGEGTWDNTLWEDEAYYVHVGEGQEQGKRAITHFTVLRKTKHYTLVECTLETGRKNQIRAQAAHHGTPITGDEKYGAKKNPLGRLALHAHLLEFLHPITKKNMHFEAPLPENFLRLFRSKGPEGRLPS